MRLLTLVLLEMGTRKAIDITRTEVRWPGNGPGYRRGRCLKLESLRLRGCADRRSGASHRLRSGGPLRGEPTQNDDRVGERDQRLDDHDPGFSTEASLAKPRLCQALVRSITRRRVCPRAIRVPLGVISP